MHGQRPAALALCFVLLALTACSRQGAPAPTTTVYLVRHAERVDDSRDSALSEIGHTRANTLAHVLRDAEVHAVFATEYTRTQQTAAPTAAAHGVPVTPYTARDAESVAEFILNEHRGENVLVVGHSNTLDDVARALGIGELSDLPEDQYDRLYVIRRSDGRSSLDRLRFGAASP